ncbi:MAG: RluA family pseudouridine synthase [Betaproteobacteria bacterium]|nr:RluA family pseudouridine synthase [Betaproteobacteria bacterium]
MVCARASVLNLQFNILSKLSTLRKEVSQVEIGEEEVQQRIDNFLVRTFKGVPKSHVYRLLRTGQVRVNSGRIDADYRLQLGDMVRLPPVRTAQASVTTWDAPADPLAVVLEDEALLVVDKPAGLAVHGGSGISSGIIEQLRAQRPQARFLELVHRLDRDTSGLLMVAKKRSALTEMHRQLREGEIEKRYLALVLGPWRNARQRVKAPLLRYLTQEGERRVSVDAQGQSADTLFLLQKAWPQFALLEAQLGTGRTHQIRVHLSHLGFPIAGDSKYGHANRNKALNKRGLHRMFLHAAKLSFTHPIKKEKIHLGAPLPKELADFLSLLEQDDG